jgi:hypothetical protein
MIIIIVLKKKQKLRAADELVQVPKYMKQIFNDVRKNNRAKRKNIVFQR